MMSSVRSQYYQQSSQISYSANPYEVPQGRNLQYSHPITVNLYPRTPEARNYKLERIQAPPRIENATNYSQISKRGGLRTNLYKILLMELRATIGRCIVIHCK